MAKVSTVSVNDFLEGLSGKGSQLVYMSDKDPVNLAIKFNEIRQGKQIVAAYSVGKVHYLAVFLEANVKVKRNKK